MKFILRPEERCYTLYYFIGDKHEAKKLDRMDIRFIDFLRKIHRSVEFSESRKPHKNSLYIRVEVAVRSLMDFLQVRVQELLPEGGLVIT